MLIPSGSPDAVGPLSPLPFTANITNENNNHEHIQNAYQMLGTLLNTLHMLTPLLTTTTLWGS